MDVEIVQAWVICPKCGGARHKVFPGEKTPIWFCQDEKYQLKVGEEVEVEEIEPELIRGG